MKLTKYEHACFTLEKDGKILVVDPGNFTTDLGAIDNVVAIVITHEHPDHFDPSALDAFIARSPDAVIYAHEGITNQLSSDFLATPVTAGEVVEATPFTLEFLGGDHAIIHSSYPHIDNLGVMINNVIFYPGDSFTSPDKPVEVLALPVTAPWLKISEAMDFLAQIKPTLAFPTHDAIASDKGKALVDRILGGVAREHGSKYQRLTEPVEIDG
jgi:L-ascorbate metabolism protein UlaG (beta-lactamase superfamily)